MASNKKSSKYIIMILLIIAAIIMLIPFIWMVLTAFKTKTESTSINPFIILPSKWRLDAFIEVLRKQNFGQLYINTILMIAGRVICAIVTSTMAGYAFGRLNFKGKNFAFALVLFQMMVPP